MRDPRQLQVVERAADLAELTYRTTRSFPSDERFGLVAQMRRAAVSVGSNVAEGCGFGGDRSFLRHLQIALGSVTELDYQAMLAQRLEVGDPAMLADLRVLTLRVTQMLSRLSSAIRRKTTVRRSAKGAAQVPAR